MNVPHTYECPISVQLAIHMIVVDIIWYRLKQMTQDQQIVYAVSQKKHKGDLAYEEEDISYEYDIVQSYSSMSREQYKVKCAESYYSRKVFWLYEKDMFKLKVI